MTILQIKNQDGQWIAVPALRGAPGQDGKPGEQGPKGDPFTYEDFTPEQLEALRGPAGKDGAKGDDGQPGADGAQGAPGADGYSPVVSLAQTSNGWAVTITDKNGAHVFEIEDGAPGPKGDSGVYVGDTAPTDDSVLIWLDTSEPAAQTIDQEWHDFAELD